MKKEFYLFRLMMLLVVASCFIFTSCGDDDEVSVGQQLVGVWKTSMDYSNWKCIELKSDGSLVYGLGITDDGEIKYPNYFSGGHWIYDDTEHTISMFTADGYYAFTYKVNMAKDGKSWTGYTTNSSGRTQTYTFIKVK